MSDWVHVYTCARQVDRPRLEADLASSPELRNGKIGLTVLWDKESAAAAYSQAIKTATARILVFAHCDVYFPQGWFNRLAWEVDRLSAMDCGWAVAGISSLTNSRELVGRIFDTSLVPMFPKTSGLFGRALATPVTIVSADELVLIVRKDSAVSFDPSLPEFHLYGTDIILEAERRGMRSYGLDMPLIHNAKAQVQLGADYARAYRYMVRKWRDRLPVPTTCGMLTANPFTLAIRRLRVRYGATFRTSLYSTQRLSDPYTKSKQLGLEQMLAGPMLQAKAQQERV
jgi:hypothetical protein